MAARICTMSPSNTTNPWLLGFFPQIYVNFIGSNSNLCLATVDVESLDYDIMAVGFEELVDLNASNMVKASTNNQRIWRDGLKRTIEEFQRSNFGAKAENFTVLCCEQLVGL